MRYVMNENFFAIGDDFTIKDDSGREVFFVDGHILAIGDKLTFQDMQGNELARVEQQLLSLGKRYAILRSGRQIATVKKKLFTFFRDAFDVEDAAQGELDAQGDFLQHEYAITRDGRTIATISKHWISLRDTYGIDVAEGEDDVLILCLAVVIDLCCHEKD